MFGCYDEVNLVLLNAVNKDMEVVDFILKFPIEEKDFVIPSDIVYMDVMEAHVISGQYSFGSFRIHVGKTATFEGLLRDKFCINKQVFDELDSCDDEICYYDEDDKHIVFAKVNEVDIVVKDIDELRMVLLSISDSFKNIKDSTAQIKGLARAKKKD